MLIDKITQKILGYKINKNQNMIFKELLNSKIDFKNWRDDYLFDFVISSSEDEPKHYPCIIVYKYVESEYIKDYVYYEFVYLNDFKKTEDTSKETDNTNI